MDNYKGFELFSDIKDVALKNRNRAVVLANIAETNTRNRLVSPKGAALIIGYFDKIPAEDKEDVKERFVINMRERGYTINE